MTELQIIKLLLGSITVQGLALLGLDRQNDKLREENKELRKRLEEKQPQTQTHIREEISSD